MATEPIDGTVTDLISSTPLDMAVVTFEGTDEYGNAVSYSDTTDAAGYYNAVVKAGNYDITAVADGYEEAMAQHGRRLCTDNDR